MNKDSILDILKNIKSNDVQKVNNSDIIYFKNDVNLWFKTENSTKYEEFSEEWIDPFSLKENHTDFIEIFYMNTLIYKIRYIFFSRYNVAITLPVIIDYNNLVYKFYLNDNNIINFIN